MKRIGLFFVLLFTSYFANAQSSAIIESLSKVGESGARVVINSDVELKSSSIFPSDKFKGFRVRIFFDNKQSSRADAADAAAKFKEVYPNLNTYTEYVPPYFKVTAGDFLTRLEAVAVWGKIKNTFPTAFVVVENIPYSALLIDNSADGVPVEEKVLEEAESIIE